MRPMAFDVGMNNGDDTAYYLHRGFKVVAVEANPSLCVMAQQRFADAIDEHRLIIENVGIAEREGEELQFWVSDHSEWSSFDHGNATKNMATAIPIGVRTVYFRRLLEKHGVPYFLKIDIEGNDRLCLQDLCHFDRPQLLSIEMSHDDGGTDIEMLANLGYRAFKCVRQNDFAEIHSGNIERQRSIRRRLEHVPGGFAGGPLRRLGHRQLTMNGWRFPRGSSGPLPDEFCGHWIEREEVQSIWHQLRTLDLELLSNGTGEWFDIHAALDPCGRLV
jgi:FkbM family methyltransferase